ncbi:MAG: insulinase family protein [Candidatus Omnitrophica bacterium]|nr:insulinase family protein [Candidatus Omnitrophota bacterium]
MLKRVYLKNGVSVIMNHMPHMESAAIGVWVAVGSENENKKISGISHFLEHMIFKGTPARSTRKIKEEIEGRGGSLNGFTSEEITCYMAKVSGRHADIALRVLSDMVLYARMHKKDIERERTVIIEEIKMYRDMPSHHVHDILSEMLWPDHPLGLSVAGNIKSVEAITREDLITYKTANYGPVNITLVLCGNLKESESLMREIEGIFTLKLKGKVAPAPPVNFVSEQTRPRVRIIYKDTEQSHLSMGIHTFRRMHPDRYALSLLHIILGANMSSRLFENVREKRGLAYEIGSEIKRYRTTGAFIVNAGIEHKNVPKAVSIIIKELKKIKSVPVPSMELKRAKEFFKVQLLLALEDTLDHMLWLGEHALLIGRLPDKNEIIRKIDSVTSDDLLRVAKLIFRDRKVNLAVIGPEKDKEKSEIEQELGELC